MSNLGVVNLYQKNPTKIKSFAETVDSSLKIKMDYEKVIQDIEWIDVIDDHIQYIENIYKNPNKFIANEEEIVKIEKAKTITVESIKHLSRNTGFIQEIDEVTGNVTPSKILNINKEEDFNTYENRLIYTLVQNMKYFIRRKKEQVQGRKISQGKNDKEIEYSGKCKILNENVNINIKLNTHLDNESGQNNEIDVILEKIKKLEQRVNIVTSMDMYRLIDRLRITLITPPIKKTNLILKNVNFQYAMKLWNYLTDYLEDHTEEVKEKKSYEDKGELKKFVDENFLLNYLVVNTLDRDYGKDLSETEKDDQKKLKAEMVDQLIDQIINLSPGISKEKLQEMIGERYATAKQKNVATIDGLQKLFKEKIDKYIEGIS